MGKSEINPQAKTVVRIEKEGKFLGVGLLISNQTVITCAHVTKCNEGDQLELSFPLAGSQNKLKKIQSTLIKKNALPAIDIAILEIKDPPPFTVCPAKFGDDINASGRKVAVFGYPIPIPGGTTAKGIIGNKQGDEWIELTGDGNHGYFLEPGFSGGGVYDADKACYYGIANVSDKNQEKRYGCYIPISKILSDLPELKPYIQFSAVGSSDKVLRSNQKLRSSFSDKLDSIELFFRRRIVRTDNQQIFTINEFIRAVVAEPQVIIYGNGGLGKSILLKRVGLDQLDKNICVVYCDAKYWKNTYSTPLTEATDINKKADNLLAGFQSLYTLKDLKEYDGGGSNVLFLLDGLNELANEELRRTITDTCEEIHRNFDFRTVLTTRHFSSDAHVNWKTFKVEKIENSVLENIIEEKFGKKISDYSTQNLEYLSIPYILDIAIKTHLDKIEGYAGFLTEHVLKGLPVPDLTKVKEKLSEIAFNAYRSDQKFIIPSDAIDTAFKKEYVDKYHILELTDNGYKFEHHLINELFVANWIAMHDDLWDQSTFDLITFEQKQSFEIIQMILEQISDQPSGEKFLTKVYNWNFYAVLHCLKNVDKNYSNEFAVMNILIFTEKLFDKFHYTRYGVKKYLDPLFEKFKIDGITKEETDGYVKDVEPQNKFIEIIQANSEKFAKGDYTTWYELFSFKEKELSEEIVYKIMSADPFIGWGSSNIIKRYELSPITNGQLRALFHSLELLMHDHQCREMTNIHNIIRWRIVHALGNSVEPKSIELLLTVLNSEYYTWVIFGALRSLLEIAMFKINADDAAKLLERVRTIFEKKQFPKLIVNEIADCMSTKTTPEKGVLLVAFVKKINNGNFENFSEKEKWTELQKKLEGFYGN